MLVVSDISEILMLQYIVNMIAQDGGAAPVGGHRLLRLFKNDYTPVEGTLIGNITECTEAGYVPITLVGSSWTTTQSLGVTTAVYSQQTFTFTTGVTAYGYYVTTIEGTPKLLWAERFSGSNGFQLPNTGGEIAIAPRLIAE